MRDDLMLSQDDKFVGSPCQQDGLRCFVFLIKVSRLAVCFVQGIISSCAASFSLIQGGTLFAS